MKSLADPHRPAAPFGRYEVIAILAAIAVAGFAAMAVLGTADRRNDEARIAHVAGANASATAHTILDRQQRILGELAKTAATTSDGAGQQIIDRVAGLLPGVRGAALIDPAGAVELRSSQEPDEMALAALAADAARSAETGPSATMLVTQTLRAGDTAIVGLARPWQQADGRIGGIAVIVVDATAFPGLDLARGDGSPLFATTAASGAESVALDGYPLTLRLAPLEHGSAGWLFYLCAAVSIVALLGLLAISMRRLHRAEREIARRAQVEQDLNGQLVTANAAASRTDELNRAKSRFFAQVTHELRTPLNAIIGFSETIRLEVFGPIANPRYLEYVGLMHDAGTHLLSLINDLLDEARIEAGKMEIAPIRLAAPALARSALDLVEMLAEGRDIAITTTGLSSCPDLNVDPRSMKQVLVNLLSNAIKYTLPGGQIDLRFCASDDGGAAIEIADTGIGMSAADLRVAFEPFGRVGDLEARRQQGTGLGLSLARALVRLHGGDLTLASQLDCGTTATIKLPPSAVCAPPGTAAAAKAPAKAA
jgi:signal transduction histidine kinase